MTLNATQELPDSVKRDEAADMLRVSTRTVDRLILDGELPATKVGRSVRIPRSAVLAMLTPAVPTSPEVVGTAGVSVVPDA